MSAVDFDIGIIGGGPAGSPTASCLAGAGVSCPVFEAENFPRAHVGESLVPATTPVLDEISALPAVDAFGFPRKYGAAWTSYHVDRGQFDLLLLQHAQSRGATVYQGTKPVHLWHLWHQYLGNLRAPALDPAF